MSTVRLLKKDPDDLGIFGKIGFYLILILGALVSIFPFTGCL